MEIYFGRCYVRSAFLRSGFMEARHCLVLNVRGGKNNDWLAACEIARVEAPARERWAARISRSYILTRNSPISAMRNSCQPSRKRLMFVAPYVRLM